MPTPMPSPDTRVAGSRRVLVTFASRHGSTEEVAHVVASVLGERGFAVDVRSATAVHGVADYDAVVVGGALYTARWHREARRLLHRERAALARMPVAVFAMGPRTLEEDDVAQSRHELDVGLAEVPEVKPMSVAVFGGVVDPAKLHFPLNHMPAVDARDWDAIRSWAAALATSLDTAPMPA